MRPKDNNLIYCPDAHRPKYQWKSQEEAFRYLMYNHDEIEEQNGYAPQGVYYCESCCCWHTTSRDFSPKYAGEEREVHVDGNVEFRNGSNHATLRGDIVELMDEPRMKMVQTSTKVKQPGNGQKNSKPNKKEAKKNKKQNNINNLLNEIKMTQKATDYRQSLTNMLKDENLFEAFKARLMEYTEYVPKTNANTEDKLFIDYCNNVEPLLWVRYAFDWCLGAGADGVSVMKWCLFNNKWEDRVLSNKWYIDNGMILNAKPMTTEAIKDIISKTTDGTQYYTLDKVCLYLQDLHDVIYKFKKGEEKEVKPAVDKKEAAFENKPLVEIKVVGSMDLDSVKPSKSFKAKNKDERKQVIEEQMRNSSMITQMQKEEREKDSLQMAADAAAAASAQLKEATERLKKSLNTKETNRDKEVIRTLELWLNRYPVHTSDYEAMKYECGMKHRRILTCIDKMSSTPEQQQQSMRHIGDIDKERDEYVAKYIEAIQPTLDRECEDEERKRKQHEEAIRQAEERKAKEKAEREAAERAKIEDAKRKAEEQKRQAQPVFDDVITLEWNTKRVEIPEKVAEILYFRHGGKKGDIRVSFCESKKGALLLKFAKQSGYGVALSNSNGKVTGSIIANDVHETIYSKYRLVVGGNYFLTVRVWELEDGVRMGVAKIEKAS